MSEQPARNPHDAFFRDHFSQKESARDFLEHFLPAPVLTCVDLNSLELTKDSFVDAELRTSQSDLLFRVSLKNPDLAGAGDGMVYVLFEHKSTPSRMAAFQLLRYMVRIWEQRHRDGFLLCPIIPLIVYHGAQTWKTARTLREIVRPPEELACFIPDFVALLYDLGERSDDEITGKAMTQAALLLLKYIVRDEFSDRVTEIIRMFVQLDRNAGAVERLRTVLRYISSATDRVSHQELKRAVQKALGPTGDKMMPTLAEEWMQQGRDQVREEAWEEAREGLRDGIRVTMKTRFPADGQSVIDRLRAVQSLSTLKDLIGLSLAASSLDEIHAFLDRELAR